jgi:deoxyadenosine/deoxycytidine kinase
MFSVFINPSLRTESDSDSGSEYEFEYSDSERESEEELEPESESESDPELFSEESPERPRIISIEGNIGAGKSTIIEKLKEKYENDPRVIFLLEPVSEWEKFKDNHGKNMLQKFYENPKKYTFAFQVMAYTTRLQILKTALANIGPEVKTIVMERSLDADHQIFAKMLREEGLMEEVEFQIYENMALDGLREYAVDGILWLATDFHECHERIAKRGRSGEGEITLNYLEKCEQYHIEWLGADVAMVCRLEGQNIEEDLDIIDKYLF